MNKFSFNYIERNKTRNQVLFVTTIKYNFIKKLNVSIK